MMIMVCARKVALSVSFLCLLLLLVSSNFGTTNNIIITIPSTKKITFFKAMLTPTNKRRSLNLNFVSKRRVPNGPDPIHNRRVGTTRLPPT